MRLICICLLLLNSKAFSWSLEKTARWVIGQSINTKKIKLTGNKKKVSYKKDSKKNSKTP